VIMPGYRRATGRLRATRRPGRRRLFPLHHRTARRGRVRHAALPHDQDLRPDDSISVRRVGALKTQLRADLTTAMRARETLRIATLRLTLAAITNAEVGGDTARELDDAEEQAVLTREARKRREAAETYAGAGRTELADAERAEERIIEEYLPRQLDDAAVTALVDEAVRQVTDASGARPGRAQMGQVMKAATAAAAGRAEGARVAAAVRSALA